MTLNIITSLRITTQQVFHATILVVLCAYQFNTKAQPYNNRIYDTFQMDTLMVLTEVDADADVNMQSVKGVYFGNYFYMIATHQPNTLLAIDVENKSKKHVHIVNAQRYGLNLTITDEFVTNGKVWCFRMYQDYFIGYLAGDSIVLDQSKRFSQNLNMTLYGINDTAVYLGRCRDYQDKQVNSAFYSYDYNKHQLRKIVDWEMDFIQLTNYAPTKYLDFNHSKILMGNAVNYHFTVYNLADGTKEVIYKESFKSNYDKEFIKKVGKISKNTTLSFHYTDKFKAKENHITYTAFLDTNLVFVRYVDNAEKKTKIDLWMKNNSNWALIKEGLEDNTYKKPGLNDSLITTSNWTLWTFNYPIFMHKGKLIKIEAGLSFNPVGLVWKDYFTKYISNPNVKNTALISFYRIKTTD